MVCVMGDLMVTREMLAAKFGASSRIWMSGSGGC